MTTQGLLEAISGAIGESDNEIGGFKQTRVTTAVSPTTALVAVFTWGGTTTITTPDTSEVVVGDWISLDSDGQLFQIVSLIFNTSVEIDNPNGYTIPTGATQSSKATRDIPVESVLDWEDEGSVGIGGVLYRYASRTDTLIQSVTHLKGGVLTAGVKAIHNVESPVIDLNRIQSALDLVRRAMLVAYAEGDDLNAIGRNIGVDRYPFLASDDVFRAIIQAVAYNPKGTVFGLELALDAMLGVGNYEIIEDLITDPCTVFIKFLGAAVTDEISVGKTFLTGPEYQPPTSDTTVDIDEDVVTRGSVGGVRWKDENLLTDCRAAYPSADLIEEYDGDTPHGAWDFYGPGAAEGTDITITGGATEFTNPAPSSQLVYRRDLRLQEESDGYFGMLVSVPTGATIDPSRRTGIVVDDGTEAPFVCVEADTAGTFKVGFLDASYNYLVGGVQLTRDEYHEVVIRKQGTNRWELYIDGVLKEFIGYSDSFSTSGNYRMTVGHLAVIASSNQMRIKQLTVWVNTLTDYWSARGTGGVGTGGATRLDVGASFFVAGDVGKLLEISGATNDINNGSFEVEALVSDQIVTLQGPQRGGLIAQFGGDPLRVEVPAEGQLFQYPDDIGKEVVITGSSLGNDGTYTINKLLQPGTLKDLSTGDTPIPEKTYIAEMTAASFVPETELSWRLNPVFTVESPVDWVMSDAGSWSGTTLTLRQALPLTSAQAYRVLSVIYSNVLSAQILENTLVDNVVIQTFPDLLFAYYPFYLADPLGYVRNYLDALTAAGVIPDFLVE